MDDDKPTAGWGRFEGEKLLIGNDPALELGEFVGESGGVVYAGTWWPNGLAGASDESADPAPNRRLFGAREGEEAWEASVEIARQTKARLKFTGGVWEHEWPRLDPDAGIWAARAREAEGRRAGDDYSVETAGSGGAAAAFEEAASALGGTERWEFTPDGITEQIRRFGLISESTGVDREYVAAVPILATGSAGESSCAVAVVGEGLYEELGPTRSLKSAEALRRLVLRGLAGEYVEERLIGSERE